MVCVCPYLQAIDTTPKLHSYTGNKRRSFKLFLVTYCLSVAESVIVLTDVVTRRRTSISELVVDVSLCI